MNDEDNGSKVSPNAAHQEIWKYFQPEDYCNSKQIRSFFQDSGQKKRNDSLKEFEKDTSENCKKFVKFVA